MRDKFDARAIAAEIKTPFWDRLRRRLFILTTPELPVEGLVLPRGLTPREMMMLSRTHNNVEFGLGLEWWFREKRRGKFRLFGGGFDELGRNVHIPTDIGSDLSIIEINHTHPDGPPTPSLSDRHLFRVPRSPIQLNAGIMSEIEKGIIHVVWYGDYGESFKRRQK